MLMHVCAGIGHGCIWYAVDAFLAERSFIQSSDQFPYIVWMHIQIHGSFHLVWQLYLLVKEKGVLLNNDCDISCFLRSYGCWKLIRR